MLLYAPQMSFARFFVTFRGSSETPEGSRLTCIQVKFELYRGHRTMRQDSDGTGASVRRDPPKVAYAIPEVTPDLY